MKDKIIEEKYVILRHSPIELIEHWALAISGFVLIFSGFGELPMYKRFMVTQIPGLAWTGDFFINLKIHYLAGMVFVSVMVFHAIYHGWLKHEGLLPKKGDFKASLLTILSMFGFGKEPKSHKYLPEQRVAYAYLGGVGLILVLTGIVKVIKNLPGVFLPPGLITAMTLAHTFATIFFLLGVMAHLAALVFKVNRPLAKSIFTGKVDAEYVRERHPYWYEELIKNQVRAETEPRAEIKEEVHAEVKGEKKVEDPHESGKEGDQVAAVLKVKGMSCQHCVMSVTRALNQLDGIRNIQVDLEKGEVRFENIKGVVNEVIEKAITDAGYEVIHLNP
jgi:formate dehydrogenase gamma subunit